jgi:hypothetical protein
MAFRRVFPVFRPRFWALLLLLVAEVTFLCAWRSSEPRALVGYLVKVGPKYLIAYRDEARNLRVSEHATLDAALGFSEQTLDLERAVSASPYNELEYTWMSSRQGNYVVHWKLQHFEPLLRLTFPTVAEANFFHDAFRSGSYSRSPFGHAVLLMPRRL